MNQSTVILIGLVVAFLAVTALSIALIGFWQSLKETNRKRRGDPISEYRLVTPPNISARLRKPQIIEFGEPVEAETDFPQGFVVTEQNTTLGKCTICQNRFTNSNHIVCPQCGAEYHDHCISEYENFCVNCGWRQQ